MAQWYVGSTKWTAVTAWAAMTAYSVGDLRRQLAAVAAGSERVFRCTTAGTSGVAEPTWTTTKGATTNDGTAVWTEVTGNSAYGWGASHARLRNAFAWAAAGDDIYISNNSAATEAAPVTYTSPGTAALPVRVLCVDDGEAPPTTMATTGVEVNTGASNNMNYAGYAVVDGLQFSTGGGASTGTASHNFTSASAFHWKIMNGKLWLATTGANACRVSVGATSNPRASMLELINTPINFANAAHAIGVQAPFRWSATPSALPGTAPTTLFSISTPGAVGSIDCQGIDLSGAGSANIASVSASSWATINLTDCKLGSSFSPSTGSVIGVGGVTLRLVNCDSGDTNYNYHHLTYPGTVTDETVVVRVGGATDGATPFSRKMVSTANASLMVPLESDWVEFWNDALSGMGVGFEVVNDGVTLTDAEAWVEVQCLATSGSPLSSVTTDRAASALATPANQASSSVNWTTTGLSSPVKQRLEATVTPAEKGPIRARVCLARASTTLYFDPLVLSGSGKQWMGMGGHVNNEAAPLGGRSQVIQNIGTY